MYEFYENLCRTDLSVVNVLEAVLWADYVVPVLVLLQEFRPLYDDQSAGPSCSGSL